MGIAWSLCFRRLLHCTSWRLGSGGFRALYDWQCIYPIDSRLRFRPVMSTTLSGWTRSGSLQPHELFMYRKWNTLSHV